MKWLRLMLGAMIANGFALIGAKVLSEAGLAGTFQNQYLFGWYASGVLMALAYSARELSLPWAKEILIAAGMAAMSFIGQICLVSALAGGAPGYIVYPIATGANVLFVAVAGVVLFKERLGWYGSAGIFCGLISVVILSLP
jgi:drug/metabolite transporter (DMT)-like permease